MWRVLVGHLWPTRVEQRLGSKNEEGRFVQGIISKGAIMHTPATIHRLTNCFVIDETFESLTLIFRVEYIIGDLPAATLMALKKCMFLQKAF